MSKSLIHIVQFVFIYLVNFFQSDLEVIEKLRTIPNLGDRFHFLRYEDIALQPESELTKLVSSLGNRKNDEDSYFCRQSVDNLDGKREWNFDKNQVTISFLMTIVSKKLGLRVNYFLLQVSLLKFCWRSVTNYYGSICYINLFSCAYFYVPKKT